MGRSEEEGEGHVQIYTHDSRHRLLLQQVGCRPFVENKQMPENKERTHTQALSLYLRKAGQWKGERTMKANRKGAGGHANVGSGRAGLPSLVRLYYLVFVIELITKTVGHLRQFDIRETDIIIQSARRSAPSSSLMNDFSLCPRPVSDFFVISPSDCLSPRRYR